MMDEYRSFTFPDYRKKYERDRQFKQEKIYAFIQPDFQNKEFKALEKITLIALYTKLESVDLDAVDMEILNISVKNEKLNYRYDGKTLRIFFKKSIEKGEEIEIEIEYKSRPQRGMFFVGPDEYYPDKDYQLWTQGEDEDTRYWLPCYDYPNERSRTEIEISVPKGYYAVSNGKLVEIKNMDDKVIYHWVENFPHPIYLTSIAAGEFYVEEDEIDNVKLLYLVPKKMKDYVKLSFVNTPDMIRFFSRLLNFKYPYEKYAQVVVYDFIFGGMENINATTLTEYTIHNEKIHSVVMSEDLVSHELAHQWFGDYLTCKDWSQGWLNEGFATYMNAVYVDHFLGHDDFLYHLYQDEVNYKNEEYRRAIVTNVYEYPSELFDRHLYEKGSRVLHMLRYEVGDDVFWSSISDYLKTYGGKSVDTYDLMRIFKEKTGKSLEQFFDQWVFQAGHPEIVVTQSYSPNDKILTLKIEQQQKGENIPDEFSFPLDIAIYTKNGRIIKKVRINKKVEQFTFIFDEEPLGVSIDPENIILKDIKFERSKESLKYILKNGETVMEKIDAIKSMEKISSYDIIDAFASSVFENHWSVAYEAISAIGSIGTDYALKAIERIMGNYSLLHPRVKIAIAKALGEFKNDKSFKLILDIIKNENNEFVLSQAYWSLGKTKHKDAFEILKNGLNISSWNEVVRIGVVNGLSELGDEGCKIIKEYTKLGYNQRLRSASATALGKCGTGKKDVMENLCDLLKDYYLPVRRAAVNSLSKINLSEAIEKLESQFSMELDGRMKREIRLAINSLLKGKEENEELKNLREKVEEINKKINEIMMKIEMIEKELKK